MTDARSSRTSSQVIVQNDSDARSVRTSAQAIVQNPSDARSSRVSMQVVIVAQAATSYERWGMIPIGI